MIIRACEQANNDGIITKCDLKKLQSEKKLADFFRRLGRQMQEESQIIVQETTWEKDELQMILTEACSYICDGAYQFSKEVLKTLDSKELYEKRDELAHYGSGTFVFVFGESMQLFKEVIEEAIQRGTQRGMCKGYARSLGNLPNNYLHTEDMENYARKLGENLLVSYQALGDEKLSSMGFGGVLAVNQGSTRPASVVVLEYRGDESGKMTALVGKGLMFDTGGYHLKSIDGMQGMKYDMCGAASILESFEILVRENVKKNIMAVLLLAENVIGPDAVKMGDVVKTLSGQTVEVYNTDAEGRLVLCDGLTYAQNHGASEIIDLATLTYSAQGALGDQYTGLFVNDEKMYHAWMQTAECTNERYWRLPLDEIYHKYLEWSICADFANYAPGKAAGASVAACFLEKFIENNTKWIHLDMVGPSVVRNETEEMREGASGVNIETIVTFIENHR